MNCQSVSGWCQQDTRDFSASELKDETLQYANMAATSCCSLGFTQSSSQVGQQTLDPGSLVIHPHLTAEQRSKVRDSKDDCMKVKNTEEDVCKSSAVWFMVGSHTEECRGFEPLPSVQRMETCRWDNTTAVYHPPDFSGFCFGGTFFQHELQAEFL